MYLWKVLLLAVPVVSFAPHASFRLSRSSATAPRTLFLEAKKTKVKDQGDELVAPVSFEDAGVEIKEEDDGTKVESMGGYDDNPMSSAGLDTSVREAVRKRTEDMGIEKSKATAEYVARKTEEALAAKSAGEQGGQNEEVFGGIDLSQIRSRPAAGAEEDDNMMPFMAADMIDDEMDDDMKKEADPVSFLPLWEQALVEIKATTWPTPLAALKKVILVSILVVVTVSGGEKFEDYVVDSFTNSLHILPTKEQVENAKPPPGSEDLYDNLAGFDNAAQQSGGFRSVF